MIKPTASDMDKQLMIKFIKTTFKILLLICFGLVLVCIVAYAKLYFTYQEALQRAFDSEKFDRAKWNETSKRIYMYNDLRKRILVQGMPIEELKYWIGEEDAYRVYNTNGQEFVCLEYFLGGRDNAGMTTNVDLIICPDKTQKYVRSIEMLKNRNDDGKTIIRTK